MSIPDFGLPDLPRTVSLPGSTIESVDLGTWSFENDTSEGVGEERRGVASEPCLDRVPV